MDMEYVYAAAILHELDREINENNMKSVLSAAGASVSESRVKALIAALEDVNIDRAVADASPELSSGTATAEQGTAAAVPAETDDETAEAGGSASEDVETADETLPETADDQEVEGDEDDSKLDFF